MFGLGTEYIEKGISFVNRKEYDNALECFNKHLEADSKNSIVLGLKALALMDLNRLDEALIYISKSLDIDSSNYEAWATKGEIFRRLNKIGKLCTALICLCRSIRNSQKHG